MRLKLFIASAFAALVVALGFTVKTLVKVRADRDRVLQNQSILLHNGRVEISETSGGNSHASTPAITLRSSEFKRSGDTLTKVAKQIGIKASRISDAATTATTTRADIVTPVYRLPSAVYHPPDDSIPQQRDSLVCFSWNDPWVSLSGCMSDSLFRGTVSATDTLDIIVHRVPKRFLFFRFGCREVRMDIISRNPHTRLTYARYYQLVK